MTDVDLDIYEDDSIEDRILHELESLRDTSIVGDQGLTSKQLAKNILGRGYSGHHIQQALIRLEADGKIRQGKDRRWVLVQ